MKQIPLTNWMPFSNILYIGDEAKDCIEIIEKFNDRLLEIEHHYSAWFGNEKHAAHEKLQRHIQYHFEGGIAIFKFKHEEEIPAIVRNECITACRDIAFEHLFCLS